MQGLIFPNPFQVRPQTPQKARKPHADPLTGLNTFRFYSLKYYIVEALYTSWLFLLYLWDIPLKLYHKNIHPGLYQAGIPSHYTIYKNLRDFTNPSIPSYNIIENVPSTCTIGTIPRYNTIETIPSTCTIGTIPRYNTIETIPS